MDEDDQTLTPPSPAGFNEFLQNYRNTAQQLPMFWPTPQIPSFYAYGYPYQQQVPLQTLAQPPTQPEQFFHSALSPIPLPPPQPCASCGKRNHLDNNASWIYRHFINARNHFEY